MNQNNAYVVDFPCMWYKTLILGHSTAWFFNSKTVESFIKVYKWKAKSAHPNNLKINAPCKA